MMQRVSRESLGVVFSSLTLLVRYGPQLQSRRRSLGRTALKPGALAEDPGRRVGKGLAFVAATMTPCP